MKKLSKKKLIVSIVFCYSLSLSLFLGALLSVQKSVTVAQVSMEMLKAVIPTGLILMIYYFIKKICHPKYFFLNKKLEITFAYKKDFVYWVMCMLTQFFAWIPLLLAYYPGLMNYDADMQIRQHMGTYSTPHPLFHTFYLKFFYNVIGERILKNVSIGVLLATITQMLLLAGMISCMHLFLKRIGLKLWGRIVALLFTCFAPFVSGMSISLVKDTLFSGLFLVVFICLCYWEAAPKEYCMSKSFVTVYVSSIAAMCLMRKNGILTIGILLLIEIFMLFCKEKRKGIRKLIIYTIIGVGIYLVLQLGAVLITKASGSSSNEALSVPYQQLAYINNVMNEEITVEEREAIYYIIPDVDIYNMRNSDPIKARARGLENIDIFVKLYFKLACRFPVQFVEAFMHHTIGYWYVFDTSFAQYYGVCSRIGYLPTLQCDLGIEEKCLLPAVFDCFDSLFSWNNYQRYPLLFILCSPSTYVWLIVMFLLWNLENTKHKWFLPFVLLFSLLIPLFFGPCVLVRYVLPYILCVPALGVIVIGMCGEITDQGCGSLPASKQ